MKAKFLILSWAIIVAACATGDRERASAAAEKSAVRPTGVGCSEIDYRSAVISRFPEVRHACRDVVMDSQGSPYVKVDAVVSQVKRRRSDRSVTRVTVDMLSANGASLRKLSFRPPRGFRYRVDGREMSADSMARGQRLRVYLPPDRWEVRWSIDTATPLNTHVHVEDIDTYLITANLEADEAFDFDSAELSANGRADLDAIVEAVGDHVPSINIFGYTDRLGEESYNLALSQRRADAARDYLVSRGIPGERVSAVGRGESDPVVSCDGMADDTLKNCLRPNRRAEVVFFVPAVADAASITVTKTYAKPLGEKIQVTEHLAVAQLQEASGVADDLLTVCAREVEDYCATTQPGRGQMLGCLGANMQAGYEFSAACNNGLESVVAAVLLKRTRLNAVGDACEAEIAACDSAPLGRKIECVAGSPRSTGCSSALSQLTSAPF